MDFFESQDQARRNTRNLVLLFLAAVVVLVALTNLLLYFVMRVDMTLQGLFGYREYDLEMFAWISGAVVVVIAGASLYRIRSLKRGGEAVAEMMGGELLVDHEGDVARRRLLNVVEEMAIASGTPVPPVYLIRDRAINAFAAGYSASDAVIGITEGAVEQLDRDQLQGVIAHEFSHILNGDMRLNINLMGVLFGILAIAVVGRGLATGSDTRRSTSRSRSGGFLVLVGVGLMLIGYVGKFFGSLIKAAVSRQREFLADASAVQFTRNPDGIAGALKRIGGYVDGSEVHLAGGDEISHMFFADGLKKAWFGAMATHPPLEDRILRIEPRWNGRFLIEAPIEARPAAAPNEPELDTGVAGFQPLQFVDEAPGATVDELVDAVGEVPQSAIETAQKVIAATPPDLLTAARQPYSARAVVYLLLLDTSDEVRAGQLSHLEGHADFGVFDALQPMLAHVPVPPALRMPLLEIAVGTLRQLSDSQYRQFLSNMSAMIRADGRMGLSEWVVQAYIRRNLKDVFEGVDETRRDRHLRALKPDIQVILSLLSYAEGRATVAPEQKYRLGMESLEMDAPHLGKKAVGFKQLNRSLDRLRTLQPLRMPKFLKACALVAAADGRVTVTERELIRVIADTLDCPMPPLG